MTPTQAIIWKYDQGAHSLEHAKPVKVRLLHPATNPRHPLPLGVLVPSPTEPALLVVMPRSGKITYWESISSAASADLNRQKQQSVQGTINGMMSGEIVTIVTEAEPRGFVLTMSTGRLAHLTVSDPQGKPSISVTFLRSGGSQSGGVFGSLRNVFSIAGWRKDVAAVRAGRSWQRGQRYVVVATTTGSFEVWDLKWNGTHSLVYDVDAKADLFKALTEGGEVFHDQQEHAFEVMDFTIIPSHTTGKELTKAKANKSSDCKLLALTVLKGALSSNYALVGLTLANGFVTIDVVHPISCYKTSMPADSAFRPQLLVPEPVQTAFVLFEKSVVLVSLVEVEESPSTQLRVEADTLPDPFQDVIDFRNDNPYKVVGCASEPRDRSQAIASCAIMIYGFGLIRVTALPMKEGQSTLDRATVTAQTKIEQAVFFGSQQQNLLDFSPRAEEQFSAAEIERAALNVNHSIMSSTSPYIAAIQPSMEQQLLRRSMALADLNKHLRKHYQPLSRIARWQLLWSAEKMAAAKALWKCYDKNASHPDKNPNHKDLFAELIEAISENDKTENQPQHNETDGVRHYFIHDVWRLEWIIPWAQEIVDLLFKESVEDEKEFDLVTKARMIGEATDIQLAGLETAFQFREANAAAYGLDEEEMIDGVLKYESGYKGLPEFWTSTTHIVGRVKELTDLSREMAKLLDEEEDQDSEDETSYLLMVRLAENNPRQVQICCQTYIERFRSLKSRDDPDDQAKGKELMIEHFAVRKGLFAALTDIGLPEKAFELAERYWDMDALVEIIDREMQQGDPESTPLLRERINMYFVKFGMRWAEAYFKKHLAGGEAVEIFNNNSKFKEQLTTYLRHHPPYAKLCWINEVGSERDYALAAHSLNLAQQEEQNLWSKKITLSMDKLTILAAKTKGQAKSDLVRPDIERIDKSILVLSIQETLYTFIKSGVSNALDAQAELDLAMERYGNRSVSGKPYLETSLKQTLQSLLAGQTLHPFDLITTMTLITDDPVQPSTTPLDSTRFFLALKILYLTPPTTLPPHDAALLERIIWRRCIIQDDWPLINRTELKPDTQVEIETASTSLFQTLLEGYRTLSPTPSSTISTPEFWSSHPPLPPSALLGAGTTPTSLRPPKDSPSTSSPLSRLSTFSSSTLSALSHDLKTEDALLAKYVDKGRLSDWWPGVREAARSRAREEAENQGEEGARKREAEREMGERVAGGGRGG